MTRLFLFTLSIPPKTIFRIISIDYKVDLFTIQKALYPTSQLNHSKKIGHKSPLKHLKIYFKNNRQLKTDVLFEIVEYLKAMEYLATAP